MIPVAVVVPTRNRPGELRRCLASIRANSLAPVEIVVVDQDPGRSAEAVCREFPDGKVRYLHHPTGGKSAALNVGIAATTSVSIAFTDDDCTVPDTWLSSGTQSLQRDNSLGIVFGGAVACPHDPDVEFVPSFVPRRREIRSGAWAVAKIGAIGGNMFCKRELLARVGGFDEILGPGMAIASGEDQDVNNRALRAGYRVLCDPELIVTHWGARRYSEATVTKLLRGYSIGIGALAAKDLRCGSIAGAYPLFREVAAEVRTAVLSLAGRRRGRFVVRTPWLAVGLWRGARFPIDRAHEIFVP